MTDPETAKIDSLRTAIDKLLVEHNATLNTSLMAMCECIANGITQIAPESPCQFLADEIVPRIHAGVHGYMGAEPEPEDTVVDWAKPSAYKLN